MVSTRVTDRPDRGGAFIHGTLVWTLVAVFLLWLVGQGISFGLSNLLGALGGLTKTATTAVTSVVSGDGDLAQHLGLDYLWCLGSDLDRRCPGGTDWNSEPGCLALPLGPHWSGITLPRYPSRPEIFP
jgi:hypothetical protein